MTINDATPTPAPIPAFAVVLRSLLDCPLDAVSGFVEEFSVVEIAALLVMSVFMAVAVAVDVDVDVDVPAAAVVAAVTGPVGTPNTA
ncbi:hypothetical protein N7533_002252 [Penicillium manginii]|uniref:uncharacterized protein n=1 Tax=Penicillium manginii TaxID=203109 RepID=UPI002547CBAB|nr:uncharacterized protein N7533_002252 [Penicillium manginii]KAJ5763571.1 hypothetical protein N7533_002252 [Penicillium manginii]